MSEIEISKNHNKILLTFETEEEAKLVVPALESIIRKYSMKEETRKLEFIHFIFGELIGDAMISFLNLDEVFEIARERSKNVKDFYNLLG